MLRLSFPSRCETDFVSLSCFMVHRASVVEETGANIRKRHPLVVMVTLGKKLMGDRLKRERGRHLQTTVRKQMQARRKRLLGGGREVLGLGLIAELEMTRDPRGGW